MTGDNSKHCDQPGEVNTPEKRGDDNLKSDRTVDNRLIEKRRLMEAQEFSVSNLDTKAGKPANAAPQSAFQLVDDGAVVAASKKSNAGAALVASDGPLSESAMPGGAFESDTQPPVQDSRTVASDANPVQEVNKVVADAETAKRFADLAAISKDLKQLSGDCSDHMTLVQQKLFLINLEAFQKRADVTQTEKDKVYGQLGKLLEAKETKLPEDDKTRPTFLRTTLAQYLLFHAAHPQKIDQGRFNTCNVTTLAERFFTRNPSIAAEIAVTTAVTGEWVDPSDKKVIKIDRESLRPSENTTTWVPLKDGARSFDTQLLNVVMVNDAVQRDHPPRKYLQGTVGVVTDGTSKGPHFQNGEHLYFWDAVHDKCLAPVTDSVRTADHKVVAVNALKPNLTLQEIADIGKRLTGESNFVMELSGIEGKNKKTKRWRRHANCLSERSGAKTPQRHEGQ